MKTTITIIICLILVVINGMGQDESATIVFYRPKRMSMAGMEFTFGNLKNGQPLIADLKNGRYVKKTVKSGEEILMQGLRQKETVSLTPIAGKIYYVKVLAGNMANFTIELADETEAKTEISRLKEAKL